MLGADKPTEVTAEEYPMTPELVMLRKDVDGGNAPGKKRLKFEAIVEGAFKPT
jgi:hypothetical protein